MGPNRRDFREVGGRIAVVIIEAFFQLDGWCSGFWTSCL